VLVLCINPDNTKQKQSAIIFFSRKIKLKLVYIFFIRLLVKEFDYTNLVKFNWQKTKEVRMKIRLIILATSFILVNCFTIGKIGYAVPAAIENAELDQTLIAEHCATFITSMLEEGNAKLRAAGKEKYENIGLEFSTEFGKSCLRYKAIK